MLKAKILAPLELADVLKQRLAQEPALKVVFTNGCFDLVHSGHVQYLEEARSLGDILVVGVNSDASVKRLKGEERPINPLSRRMILLAALESVSYVTCFEEDTPYELIKLLQPNILVKGGDWQPQQIVGSDLVLARGGEVHSLSFEAGISSTELIRRIRSEYER